MAERPIHLFVAQGIVDTNKIKLLYLGNLANNEQIRDSILTATQIGEELISEIYGCNIVYDYVLSNMDKNKKNGNVKELNGVNYVDWEIPILHLVITKVTKFMRAEVCKLYLNFYMEKDFQDNLENYNQVVENDFEIPGIFLMELEFNNKKHLLEPMIDVFPGNKQMMEIIIGLTRENIFKQFIDKILIKINKDIDKIQKEKFAL